MIQPPALHQCFPQQTEQLRGMRARRGRWPPPQPAQTAWVWWAAPRWGPRPPPSCAPAPSSPRTAGCLPAGCVGRAQRGGQREWQQVQAAGGAAGHAHTQDRANKCCSVYTLAFQRNEACRIDEPWRQQGSTGTSGKRQVTVAAAAASPPCSCAAYWLSIFPAPYRSPGVPAVQQGRPNEGTARCQMVCLACAAVHSPR